MLKLHRKCVETLLYSCSTSFGLRSFHITNTPLAWYHKSPCDYAHSDFCFSGVIKGIFSDSNNIVLWHESEDTNKKAYFQNFSWFQFCVYKSFMIMCTGIAP